LWVCAASYARVHAVACALLKAALRHFHALDFKHDCVRKGGHLSGESVAERVQFFCHVPKRLRSFYERWFVFHSVGDCGW